MFSFPEQYGWTPKNNKLTTEFLKEVSTQWDSALTLKVLYMVSWMKFLRNCECYLPDPIESPSNEGTEAYRLLKYKLRIWDFVNFFCIVKSSKNISTRVPRSSLKPRQDYLGQIQYPSQTSMTCAGFF